jgi:hypothetical protein
VVVESLGSYQQTFKNWFTSGNSIQVDCYNLTHMPCGLGKLTSLQTLTLFVVSKEDPTACSSSKHCGGLAELNKLDLRGELEINNLEWVKDATSETKAANLKEKKHLNKLVLRWNPRVMMGVRFLRMKFR